MKEIPDQREGSLRSRLTMLLQKDNMKRKLIYSAGYDLEKKQGLIFKWVWFLLAPDLRYYEREGVLPLSSPCSENGIASLFLSTCHLCRYLYFSDLFTIFTFSPCIAIAERGCLGGPYGRATHKCNTYIRWWSICRHGSINGQKQEVYKNGWRLLKLYGLKQLVWEKDSKMPLSLWWITLACLCFR